jgi:hypothetical protein
MDDYGESGARRAGLAAGTFTHMIADEATDIDWHEALMRGTAEFNGGVLATEEVT